VNGKIVTIDDRFSLAHALAIRGDRIAAVGDDDQIKPLIGPGTEAVDPNDRTALPGINDSHYRLFSLLVCRFQCAVAIAASSRR
jgi:predicted amidohydrolase YtcJ